MITVLPTKFQIHFKFSLGLHRRGRPVCRSGGDKIVNLNLTFLQFQFGSERQIQILLMATGLHWKWFGDTANNANGGKYYFYIFIFWQRLWRPRPSPRHLYGFNVNRWHLARNIISDNSYVSFGGELPRLNQAQFKLSINECAVRTRYLFYWNFSLHLFIYAARYWWTQSPKVESCILSVVLWRCSGGEDAVPFISR